MKKFLILSALFLIGGIKLNAQAEDSDSLGLPGDNLDLYGVLDLFKQSSSIEDFEKKINDPANEVNNLDLNEDQNVDYIRVIDNVDGASHAVVLQVPISASESQDVAVIEIEKTGTEEADLQIVGDEELYGEDYMIEASNEEKSTTEGQWQGFRPMVVVVNVYVWPCVRFIYAPAYVVWVSPYRWMYYPAYWKPWHPVMWHVHHAHVMHYHAHYVCVHHCRMVHAHAYYHGHRCASPAVHHRYEANHQRHAANQVQRNGKGGAGNKSKVGGTKENGSGHATGKQGQKGGNKKAGGNGGQKKAGTSSGQKKGGGGKH